MHCYRLHTVTQVLLWVMSDDVFTTADQQHRVTLPYCTRSA